MFANIAIKNIYGPTKEKSQDEKEEFCEKLGDIEAKIVMHPKWRITGDVSTKIEKDEYLGCKP